MSARCPACQIDVTAPHEMVRVMTRHDRVRCCPVCQRCFDPFFPHDYCRRAYQERV